MAGNPVTHPSTDTLRALALGKLARDKTEALLSHLRTCPDCSQKASTLSDANLPTTGDTSRPDWTLSPLAGPKTGGAQNFPIPFGRYRLLKLLGKGGMGAVYLAHDTQLDRPVALKIPLFEAADGPQIMERFYREARAAATIRHAHVCPLHDVGEIDGTPYLTMAFVEGKSLSEVAATRPLTARLAAMLVRKLALALKEAHQLGIIHRDLKPANVMIDQRGEPLIMDFGLARRTKGGDARLTQQGSIMGTPAYMAPEQISGDLEGTGPASDVYSLGVILYELLTGRLPFTGDPLAVLAQALMDEPPAPSEVRPGLDPDLEAICLKAMAKKVADRYRSMAELAAALTDNLRGTSPTAAPPATLTPRPAAAAAKTDAAGLHVSQMGGLRSLAMAQAQVPTRPAKADKPRRPRSKRARRRGIPLWVWLSGAGAGFLLLLVILWAAGVFKGKPKAGSLAPETSGSATNSKVPDGDKKALFEPKSANAHLDLGNVLRDKGDKDGAATEYREAIRLDPKLVLAHSNLGSVLYDKRDPVRAEAAFREAIRLDPKVANAHKSLGTVLLDKGDKAGAEAEYREAIHLVTPLFPPGKPALFTTPCEDKEQNVHSHIFLTGISPDGRLFFGAGDASPTGRMHLWNVANPNPQQVRQFVPGGLAWFTVAQFLPDSRSLVVCYSSKSDIYLWNVATEKVERQFVGHSGLGVGFAVSPDGKRLLSWGDDRTVRLWDVTTGSELRKLQGHTDKASGVFSPDGKQILTFSPDQTLRLWDVETGKELKKLVGHIGTCTGCFSPDGKQVLSYGSDGTLRLWDLGTGKELREFTGQTKRMQNAGFVADGWFVVGSSEDKKLRLWDTASGKLVRVIDPGVFGKDAGPITPSPDGRLAARECL